MLLEAIQPIEDTKDFNIHKDTCHTLAATHTHTRWTRCILHGWLPDNTDETLDWIEVPAVMKTNYLDDSQTCRYIHCQEILLDATLHHISVIVFCREYSTFSLSPDTKVSSPQRRDWWQNEAIMPYATAPLSFKSSKGQRPRSLGKIPQVWIQSGNRRNVKFVAPASLSQYGCLPCKTKSLPSCMKEEVVSQEEIHPLF